MRILVTAGPTREFLDPVRYLSNQSTGTLGYAIAAAAVRRGHEVTLVSGPVSLEPPPRVRVVRVVSAADLARETLAALPDADAVVMTAAVADYTPASMNQQKIKKGGQPITLSLVPTLDVLAEIGRRKRADQVVMGFSLETQDGPAEAARKLEAKNCDFIVLNGPANFGDVPVNVTVLSRRGSPRDFARISKTDLADTLLDLLERSREKR